MKRLRASDSKTQERHELIGGYRLHVDRDVHIEAMAL
jgi:hypothetical protein